MRILLAALLVSLLPQTSLPTGIVDYDITLPPPGSKVSFTALGKGVQIYSCSAPTTPDQPFQWSFQAPEAILTGSAGEALGTHGAGPTWTLTDGTLFTGKLVAQRVSQNPLSINWLLLAATDQAGRRAYIRRSDTQGGVPPADGCDAAHPGVVVRVPYTATYTFYSGL